MSVNQRGMMIFFFILAFAVILCGVVPFMLLPGAGIAMALPVIQVPGEVYAKGMPSPDFEFTNTLMGTLIADAIVILLALLARRASNGWTKEVPGRGQGLMEGFIGFVYGLVKQMAGTRAIVRNLLFPLVASIFFFLLIANWLELVPGVDSVGIMHCGEPDKHNGYARSGSLLYNDAALFSGYAVATEEQYLMCEDYLLGYETESFGVASVAELEEEVATLSASEAEHAEEEDDHGGGHHGLSDLQKAEARLEAAYAVESLTVALEAEDLTEEEQAALETELLLAQTQIQYPHAIVPLNQDQIESGVQPYGFIVTPYVRAAATDLNLTLALALISFFAIQYFGISALGAGYFQKFINIGALGNLSKRPLGAVDFLVGLFEIISEFSKVISLAFRLFGNIFAGQLLLFIMAFLVATMLPVIFYGLEFIVGFIQALVFAVLTLVFSAQAMEDHSHHDDEHGHEH